MQIQVNKADHIAAAAMVDSLEHAIEILEEIYHSDVESDYDLSVMRTTIQDLQMLRVAYMLVARNASKTQGGNKTQPTCPICSKVGCLDPLCDEPANSKGAAEEQRKDRANSQCSECGCSATYPDGEAMHYDGCILN